ncbi:MAG TPA: asparagine synthase-related protein [Longimicrobiales bacterium]|nr:asparagine synthase-related protein [Longimicrobiales bacterium]
MYLCALRPRGEKIERGDVFGYMARLNRAGGASLHTIVEGPFAAIATSHPTELRRRIGRFRHIIGVGDVRLDNRAEIARLAQLGADGDETDLELVLACLDVVGEACIPRLLGDYAFAAWDARAQKLLAVRDAFGVKPLFRRQTDDLALFSSTVGPLHDHDAFDTDYMRGWLAGAADPDGTIWRGVEAVAAGSIARVRGTVLTTERYWRPEEFVPATAGDEQDDIRRFRELLEEGVRTRVAGEGDVWSHLSGGLDSSSVVSLAHLMGGRLGGTVTVVDTMGSGDERVYADAVVQRFGLRNEQVTDYWPWQDDGEAPPLTDHPTPIYMYYARDRQVWNTVRSAGSRVLLSGLGADHYLYGNLDYITDMASAGQYRAALHELTDWSVSTRQSFWRMGRRYLVDPFMPQALRGSGIEDAPTWLLNPPLVRSAGARVSGHRFADTVTSGMRSLPHWIQRWPFGDEVEMRYPFLYRPLVEWSLRLPARTRVRPEAHKWVLRQAMKDVLPESVRTRRTKGSIDARMLWSLQRERKRLDVLLRDPILAQLGCVDANALRASVEAARRGVRQHNVQLFTTLALETWLSVRDGAWQKMAGSEAASAA